VTDEEAGSGGGWLGRIAVLVVGLAVAGGVVFLASGPGDAEPTPDPVTTAAPAGVPSTTDAAATARWTSETPTELLDREPYRGLGAWVDVFDYAETYQDAGDLPVVGLSDLDAMVAYGVDTLFLQAARADDRAPEGLVEPDTLASLLEEAHDRNIAVVAWYLPTFEDLDLDVERVVQMREFLSGRGDRFDGVAVDIEATTTVPDPTERSARLVDLSRRVSESLLPGDVVGAIVLPPTLIEIVNPDLWPDFPWLDLAPHYGVWLPMNYWTGRTESSGLQDGFAYNVDSIQRLRLDLGDPEAVVHPIGGVGDAVTEDGIREFVRAVTASRSIGGSIYDYRTLSSGGWAILRDRLG
jgi:hypothetical protein